MLNSDDQSTSQPPMRAEKSYVLITPCRDEANCIEGTLQAVVAQTTRPKKWVIVSDGSVDGTDEIVERYAKKHDFILLLRRPGDRARNFGSKVESIRLGYQQLQGLQFEFIGNLDADITFDSSYYTNILSRFERNERLGLAGGLRLDIYEGQFVKIRTAQNSVSGAVQLFRRQCYEEIGGYQKLPCGGVDAVAETMARMCGWQVESFPDLIFYHHRPTGTASGGVIKARFKKGEQHYLIGYHPLFHVASCMFHLPDYPFILGGLASIAGYAWSSLSRRKKMVPDNFVHYLRGEQWTRLRSLLLAKQDPSLRTLRSDRPDDYRVPASRSSLAGKIEE
jgi:biofilm PGA synthesis N-glycosyltransferase PgaC